MWTPHGWYYHVRKAAVSGSAFTSSGDPMIRILQRNTQTDKEREIRRVHVLDSGTLPSRSQAPVVDDHFTEEVEEMANMMVEMKDEYICPITGRPMKNPTTAADGHSYGKVAIETWMNKPGFANSATYMSPKNGQQIPKHLVPNQNLKSCIHTIMDEADATTTDMHVATASRACASRLAQQCHSHSAICGWTRTHRQ